MNTSKETLKLFWSMVKHYPWLMTGLIIGVPSATLLFRYLPPLIAADVLNKLSNGDYISGDVWGSFGRELMIFGALIVGGGVIAWRIVIYLLWKLETKMTKDIYEMMFSHYMQLDSAFHSNSFGGSLVSRTSKLVGAYVRIQDTFLFHFYTMIISIIFVTIVLYPRAPLFVWLFLGITSVFVVVTYIMTKDVREKGAIEANAQNKVTGYLADAITNVSAVKSFSASKFEQTRFEVATENTRRKSMDLMWSSIKRDTFSSTVTSILVTASLISGVAAIVVYQADIATVFLVLTYAGIMGDRLWEFSAQALRNYNRAMGDAQEAVQTLHTKPTIKDPANPKLLTVSEGRITFNKMAFSHHESGDDALFNNFNLEIKPNEKVGLVGHSGSGKTTLTKLILRFMDIDGGEINIDGQSISSTTQEDLRRHISYVPQEPLLFHRSLSENIAYGNPDASEKDIIAASKKAHAHEFIKDLPNGYETLVGERGVKLSGGQRQRVAIARAILKDSPILILDEATSALDSESEVLIQKALKELMKNRTAIVIAHRLSTIQKMDRIIVLENGGIVEEGTHKELLKKKGTYAKLWAHQSGGFLED